MSSSIFSVVLLVAVVVALVYGVMYFKKKLKWVQLSITSNSPKPQPDVYKYKLLHYTQDITNSQNAYGLFQKGNNYWIVSATSPTVLINIKDIYTAFKGRPIGFIVVPGTQFNNNSFIIMSSDGKFYNPWTISHTWRQDFQNLPQHDPVAIDGRPLTGAGVTNGMFNKGVQVTAGEDPAVVGAILFRFYYPGFYVEEQGCIPSPINPGSTATGTNKGGNSCTINTVQFTQPTFKVSSYYTFSGQMYTIATDGLIYKYNGSGWDQDLSWLSIFAGLSLPDPQPLTSTDRTKLYLMGADFDNGVPVFLIYENGTRYLVDASARKYDLFKTLVNQSITPSGNPLDFTKAGPGEFDYIILFTDKKIYGPSLPASNGYSKNVSDFEALYPAVQNDTIVSISSVNKWQYSAPPGSNTTKYYLIFLYESGRWFEAQYDLASNTINGLGQSDSTAGKWNSWPHVQSVLSTLSSTQTYKISSYGWRIFVFDTAGNTGKNLVYSINDPPESWVDMLFCTNNSNGDFSTSSCVGAGGWLDYQFSTASTGPFNMKADGTVQGFILYNNQGLDVEANPGTVTRKIPLQQCLNGNNGANVIVYDESESDCHVYTTVQKVDTSVDYTKAIFVNPSYDASFQNRFCVQHTPSGKYLYWDFTDPDNQHLGLMDSCIYNGDPNILNEQSPATGDVMSLQRSLGAMWAFSGDGLFNMNGSAGGFLQSADQTIKMNSDGNFQYSSGEFSNGGGVCFHSDGTNFSNGGCTVGEWDVQSIPCPNFTSTGYISEYCASRS